MIRTALVTVIGLGVFVVVAVFVLRSAGRLGNDKSKVYKMGGEVIFIAAIATIAGSLGLIITSIASSDFNLGDFFTP